MNRNVSWAAEDRVLDYAHVLAEVDKVLLSQGANISMFSRKQRLEIYDGCMRNFKKLSKFQANKLRDQRAQEAVRTYLQGSLQKFKLQNSVQYKQGKTMVDDLISCMSTMAHTPADV